MWIAGLNQLRGATHSVSDNDQTRKFDEKLRTLKIAATREKLNRGIVKS